MNIVLRPQRDLDIRGASLLQQKVLNLLPPSEPSAWVIDLVQVNSVNHFGLTALMGIRRAAKKHSCLLYLLNVKPTVRYMLEITELDRQFTILERLDEAFSSKIRLMLC
ncbi:STAS domain-containing protein [Spirulina sp. CS-785/01]|uniref:STAS domain-containing protein n=1 Tax=Spirulina sp. CS-785/01 TaxID=3021716 RepID=UPI00232BBE4C|nr:STAS domain-containing protein [Spirulina sp. CS-785/01]MDB9315933.1 STAS domain-containing protein [Spirulina sp. CS-785/01]